MYKGPTAIDLFVNTSVQSNCIFPGRYAPLTYYELRGNGDLSSTVSSRTISIAVFLILIQSQTLSGTFPPCIFGKDV